MLVVAFFQSLQAMALAMAPMGPVLAIELLLVGSSSLIALLPILLVVLAVVALGQRRVVSVRNGSWNATNEAAQRMGTFAQFVLLVVFLVSMAQGLLLATRLADQDPPLLGLAWLLIGVTVAFSAHAQIRLLQARRAR